MLLDHEIGTIWEFHTRNFHVRVYAAVEDMPIRDSFDPTCYDIENMERQVRRGVMDWFVAVAKVTHKPTGKELGMGVLGGCLYDDYRDFDSVYRRDLVREAIDEARVALDRLQAHSGLVEASKLALKYLEHPDVQSLPFALPAATVAKRLRTEIERRETA